MQRRPVAVKPRAFQLPVCYPFFMQEAFSRIPSPEDDQERLQSAIEKYLEKHVHDVMPHRAGRGEALANVSGASFGCADVTIDRCHPKLLVRLLRLERGKSVVLIGPNGGGKSTIFDAIMETGSAEFNTNFDQGAYAYGNSVHGKYFVRLSRLNQEEMLANIDDFTPEEVLEAMERRLFDEFPVDWENGDAYDRNLSHEETRQRLRELRGRLEQLFHLSDFSSRSIQALSGGERTKLSLCLVFLSEPDVLLLDEPTNHLDLESIAKLSEIIRLYNKTGVGVLSVSHVDSYLREAGSGGVVEIHQDGKERTAAMSSAPYASYIKNRARESFTIIEKNIVWPERRGRSSGALATTAHERITIPDSPLQNVAIPSLLPQDVWALCGNNGTGKTLLLQEMAGEGRAHAFHRSKGVNIAYLPQFWPEEMTEASVEDFFSWIRKKTDRHNVQATTGAFVDAIKAIGFRSAKSEASAGAMPLLRRKLSSFSAGEQRLLWFVAVSCFGSIDALLLDEPTNHLDPRIQEVITKAMQDFTGTVVFSTHDLQLLDAMTAYVGKKGGTLAPKNVVLTKKDGRTTIEISKQNPADYMRSFLQQAKKSARTRLQGKV